MTPQRLPSWSEIKAGLQDVNEKGLTKIIRDLYQLSKENQIFLASRMGIGDQDVMLEPYRRAIRRQFNPNRGFPKLNMAAARKVLTDFKRVNFRLEAMAELLVYYVEQGVACTLQYGDIHERFYSNLSSAFDEATVLIRESGDPRLIEKFRPRFKDIVADTIDIGWGFHDYLKEVYYNEYPPEQEE
ncbi:MAG: hypothetical protein AB9873_13470 [Syntrophobacteraceae bacterium]